MSEEHNPYMQPEAVPPENTAFQSPRDAQQLVYPPGYDYYQQPVYPPGYDYSQLPVYPPRYDNYGQQVPGSQPQGERRSVKPLVSFILSCVSMILSMYASFFFFTMLRKYKKHVENINGLRRNSFDYIYENADYFFVQGSLRFFADCVFLVTLGVGITAIIFAIISINKKRQWRVFSIIAICIASVSIIFASTSAIVMVNTVF